MYPGMVGVEGGVLWVVLEDSDSRNLTNSCDSDECACMRVRYICSNSSVQWKPVGIQRIFQKKFALLLLRDINSLPMHVALKNGHCIFCQLSMYMHQLLNKILGNACPQT